MKRIFYFYLGLMAWLSLLCSIAYTAVTNENQMTQGFLRFSQTAELNVPASRYGDYAHGLSQYLSGKTKTAMIRDPDTGEMANAFSDKENAHLKDVWTIAAFLKIMRYAGGGLAVAALGFLYFRRPGERKAMLWDAVRGFALSALFLLFVSSALIVWGIVNFDGLFVSFHQLVFTNDLWLLNPSTDVLMALMPLPFFTWYAGEMLKSMLPVLAMMLLVIVAFIRISTTQKKEENTK